MTYVIYNGQDTRFVTLCYAFNVSCILFVERGNTRVPQLFLFFNRSFRIDRKITSFCRCPRSFREEFFMTFY